MFKEDFLHYIWKFKRFNTQHLVTTTGETIQIIKVGIHNQDSGPDFFNTLLKIGNTTWAGNVEIHIKSSDWNAHNHQKDKAYDNVILHVVYEDNAEIKNTNNNLIPTLELKENIDLNLLHHYHQLIYSKNKIPCGNQLNKITLFELNNWLERLLLERLERKTNLIINHLQRNKNNFDETFYTFLFKYFGLNVNAIPFEQLAQNTPLKIIEKHPQQISVEALLYGQAGFLNDYLQDEYFQRLQKEYIFLRVKFQLQVMDKVTWKFSKLRPSNFPTIRISQLAMLLKDHPRLFSKIIELKHVKSIQQLFKAEASAYWLTHYQFGVESKFKPKKVGKTLLNNLIINVVAPFLFVFGKQHQQEKYINLALQLLEQTHAESNSIISNWKALGIEPTNAAKTQALIELKNNYCTPKKCLSCYVGNRLLSES
ncbi:MAG: DUF2851 family protein [Vicingaceae bacterium]|nr:DUF2851 family protein [Vicingaceae bacterium]